MDLIEPSELVLKDKKGNDRTYILSDFPAVQGREIISKYPIANMPKLGDYPVSEETMLKLMSYVAVIIGDGKQQRLVTMELVNNHVPNWEMLAKIEVAMMEKNCSFFTSGMVSTFFDAAIQNIIAKISAILTPSSAPSSATDAPLSMNYEQSIA